MKGLIRGGMYNCFKRWILMKKNYVHKTKNKTDQNKTGQDKTKTKQQNRTKLFAIEVRAIN